jgi:hypothetical protein
MFPRTKNRKAISAVLTTMIILVASVVLATGVVLYGTSLFQTNASSQSIITTGTQLWLDSAGNSGWAWGAFDVRNTGDKILSIDQIQIRGQAVPFANWYFDKDPTRVTSTNFQQALNYTGLASTVTGKLNNYTGAASGAQLCGANAAALNVYLFGQAASTASTPQLCMAQSSGPISLAPGEKAIIYFKVTQNLLTPVDASSSNSVAVYAGKSGSPISVTAQSK